MLTGSYIAIPRPSKTPRPKTMQSRDRLWTIGNSVVGRPVSDVRSRRLRRPFSASACKKHFHATPDTRSSSPSSLARTGAGATFTRRWSVTLLVSLHSANSSSARASIATDRSNPLPHLTLSGFQIDQVHLLAYQARQQIIHVIVAGHLVSRSTLHSLAGVWTAIQKGRRHPRPRAKTK